MSRAVHLGPLLPLHSRRLTQTENLSMYKFYIRSSNTCPVLDHILTLREKYNL